nr:MAG TPA: hypothetical protein [Caudoviricetes sp.]
MDFFLGADIKIRRPRGVSNFARIFWSNEKIKKNKKDCYGKTYCIYK